MDNFRFEMTSDKVSHLETAIALVCGATRYRTVGYGINPVMVRAGWDGKPIVRPVRLVFYWSDSQVVSNFVKRAMTPQEMADLAVEWLGGIVYDEEPDIDGSCERGWRLYNEPWGHVDELWSAFLAVTPEWAMYGK